MKWVIERLGPSRLSLQQSPPHLSCLETGEWGEGGNDAVSSMGLVIPQQSLGIDTAKLSIGARRYCQKETARSEPSLSDFNGISWVFLNEEPRACCLAGTSLSQRKSTAGFRLNISAATMLVDVMALVKLVRL